jgi:hypothetical protein
MSATRVALGGLALFLLVFLLDPYFFRRRPKPPKPLNLAVRQTQLDGFGAADSNKDS